MKVKIKKNMAGNESEFKRVECKRINDKKCASYEINYVLNIICIFNELVIQ